MQNYPKVKDFIIGVPKKFPKEKVKPPKLFDVGQSIRNFLPPFFFNLMYYTRTIILLKILALYFMFQSRRFTPSLFQSHVSCMYFFSRLTCKVIGIFEKLNNEGIFQSQRLIW